MLDLTPQPSQAVPKRPPEAPRLPGGYPYVIRRLSVLIGIGHHTFYPPLPRHKLCCTDTASKRVKHNTKAQRVHSRGTNFVTLIDIASKRVKCNTKT